MAVVKEVNNVLNSYDKSITDKDNLIEYLLERYPQGFNQPVDIFKNDILLALGDYECPLANDDEVMIVFKPAAEIALQVLITMLVTTAINYIFSEEPPSMPQVGSTDYRSVKNPQSVYSLNSNQNSFGAGQTIPVIYGTVKTTPSLIAPPYRKYIGNEEILYQLMCLGQGELTINDILISDTSSTNINTDSFDYRIISQADLVSTNVTDFIGDSDYTELVNQVKIVENLEMRGTPSDNIVRAKLINSSIEFTYNNAGEFPDISSLQAGSEIILSGTQVVGNSGTFTVATANDTTHVVTLSDKTFTEEPTQVLTSPIYNWNVSPSGFTVTIGDTPSSSPFYSEIIAGKIYSFTLNGTAYGSVKVISKASEFIGGTVYSLTIVTESGILPTLSAPTISGYQSHSEFTATFETTYGSYTIAEDENLQGLKSVELDFDLPRGLYDSTAGAFTDRTVEGTAYFDAYYANGTFDTFSYVFSYTNADNSPMRETFIPDVISNIVPTHVRLALRIKRDTAEPADTASQDKIHLQRVKGLYANDFGNQDFGNVTLIWARIKATNAISSLGQHSIHAWVTRADVGNTVHEVVTDIITNADYGANLSSSILNLPVTTETINGAFESQVTTAEALRVAGNAGRYQVKKDGDIITLVKDDLQALPVCIYNETNIVKDSLVSTYNLGKTKEIDGYRVLYRNSTTFEEEEELYPALSLQPEVVELWGVTSSTIALEEATYLWKKYLYKRNQVEFQSDYQGYIPQYNDKIIVSHSLFKNSQASELESEQITVSGTRELTLVDTVEGTPNQIIVRGPDGTPEEYPITNIAINVIEVTMLDSVTLLTDFTTERTKLSLGTATSMSKEYTITSIKPSSENLMTISAVNYDTRVYE